VTDDRATGDRATGDRVIAVGGTRTVPAPDPVARDYLLLALRLDQLLPGTVDAFFGPAELKAQVDMEQLRSPVRLAEDAAALRERLGAEVEEPDRRHWLDLQLVALSALAEVGAGARLPYVELVRRCFAYEPVRRPESRFEAAAAELEARLPVPGTLADRLAAEDAAWTVAPDRVAGVVDVLVRRFRDRAARMFELPPGEDLRVSLVRDRLGRIQLIRRRYRSRVDINLDLPIRLPALVGTVAHETIPGHHLEHASKELALVEQRRCLEASILLINTPECLISEGLANVGRDLAVAPDERADLLVELAPAAGLPLADDRWRSGRAEASQRSRTCARSSTRPASTPP
jgi:hypothetical protein